MIVVGMVVCQTYYIPCIMIYIPDYHHVYSYLLKCIKMTPMTKEAEEANAYSTQFDSNAYEYAYRRLSKLTDQLFAVLYRTPAAVA